MSDDEGAAPEPVEVELSVMDALKDVRAASAHRGVILCCENVSYER